ncbi:hypothetical protein PYW07_009799 [Mythimna separata]|uniref:Hexosyltransferase n=1 Tax=Mythimna separata TaxID=271217 RepID=A0AAD8DMK9_MYTSE|nr:hypothetical protein PYW07_009799 [Mythimna separata]
MFILMLKILIRKVFLTVKYFGRPKCMILLLPVVLSVLLLWPTVWWFAEETSLALLPPPPPDQNLDHYRRNRSLLHYMTQIQAIIEPSSAPCATLDEVPVIILVSSAPSRLDNRMAVRETWAKHQPTYFVLGLSGDDVDEQLVDTYIEAKQYSDMIVFDFRDHYQNLTLKTALMMRWSLRRCPQAQFLFKTDDDVLVNPWTLRKVLKENEDAQLLGYSKNDTYLHRDEYTKWFIPRWLLGQDQVSRYLSGTGYIISGDYLGKIFTTAARVPMVNLEDVYFTYLVARQELGLTLTHDRRLSPYKPWLKLSCLYQDMASIHSFAPEEMIAAWLKIQGLENEETGNCWFFDSYLKEYSELALF